MVNRVPRFTLLSLISAPLLTIVSLPLWRAELARENPTDPYRLAGFALLLCLLFTACIGGVAGLVFVLVAHRRRESWHYVRLLTLLGNALLVGCIVLGFCGWVGGFFR